MNKTNFILKIPEINEKDGRYYLFKGLVFAFDSKETAKILELCMKQGILKRKIIINKIATSAAFWTKRENDALFEKTYSLSGSLESYHKKESASLILISLCPHVSEMNREKLLRHFLNSKYKNNRIRAYGYLLDNWSAKYRKLIEKIWFAYKDFEIIDLLIRKMPETFLIKNFREISSCFDEDDLKYDFQLKILRNSLFARLVDYIPSKIENLKKRDPVSYLFIMKESKRKVDPTYALKVYIKYQTHYLSRWYSEMGLWEDILKSEKNVSTLNQAFL